VGADKNGFQQSNKEIARDHSRDFFILSSFFFPAYTLKIKSKYFFNKSLTIPRMGIVAAMP